MHSINVDLLRATARHHPDGRPKDAHGHHRQEHIAALRAARHQRWAAWLRRLAWWPAKPARPQDARP